MVSITAFRSVFVAHGARVSKNKEILNRRTSYSESGKRARKESKDADLESLPKATAGVVTGIRTVVRGSRLEDGERAYGELRGGGGGCEKGKEREVVVTKDVSWEEEVSRELWTR